MVDPLPDTRQIIPCSYSLLGRTIEVHDWINFITSFARFLHSTSNGSLLEEPTPQEMTDASIPENFRFSTNRYCIGANPQGMLDPRKVDDNLWVDISFSSAEYLQLARWMLYWCDLQDERVLIHYQSKPERTAAQPTQPTQPAQPIYPIQPVQPIQSTQTSHFYSRISPEFIQRCGVILKKYFQHGWRNDALDKRKFIARYAEEFSVELSENECSNIAAACTSNGISIGDKIMTITDDAINLVRGIMEGLFNSDCRQFYYSKIFSDNAMELQDAGIDSEEILTAFMRRLFPTLNYQDKFCRRDSSDSAENDVLRVLSRHGSSSIDELSEYLPGYPLQRIEQVCNTCDNIIRTNNKFTLPEEVQFNEDEVLQVGQKIEDAVKNDGYILLKEFDLPESESLNCDISQMALKRAMIQKYFAGDYVVTNQVISKAGTSLSQDDLIKQFCCHRQSFTLESLQNISEELYSTGLVNGLKTARKYAIQISSDTFVNPQLIPFDKTEIDKVLIDIICVNDHNKLQCMTLLQLANHISILPTIPGYQWTQYMLASYCRLISPTFSFVDCPQNDQFSVSGVIVLKLMYNRHFPRGNNRADAYWQLVAKCATEQGIPPSDREIQLFILREGFADGVQKRTIEKIRNMMDNN